MFNNHLHAVKASTVVVNQLHNSGQTVVAFGWMTKEITIVRKHFKTHDILHNIYII